MRYIKVPLSLVVMLFMFAGCGSGGSSSSDGKFKITIDTTKTGLARSGSKMFKIPTNSAVSGYNYSVDCNNDGINEDENLSGNYTCVYDKEGVYTVAIGGDFPAIWFNGLNDAAKLISIDQWGDIEWKSMFYAFSGCVNLERGSSDTPNLKNVQTTTRMFFNASKFNQNISDWNTTSVRGMTAMFFGASSFDQDLGSWHIENVMSMKNMFVGSALTSKNYSKILIGWSKRLTKVGSTHNVRLDVGNIYLDCPISPALSNASRFCDSAAAKQNLISAHGWSIIDGESIPYISYYIDRVDVDLYRTGALTPIINWKGDRGAVSFSTDTPIGEIWFDSLSGRISWSPYLKLGIHKIDVNITNSAGSYVTTLTLDNTLEGVFEGTYNSSKPFSVEFKKDKTVIVKASSDTATGLWSRADDGTILVNYSYPTRTKYSLKAELHRSASRAWISGSWYSGYDAVSDRLKGPFSVDLNLSSAD